MKDSVRVADDDPVSVADVDTVRALAVVGNSTVSSLIISRRVPVALYTTLSESSLKLHSILSGSNSCYHNEA